jgi:hypothetical protein
MANLFDPPGKPFGYAYLEETTRIEDHVRRRMGYPRLDDRRCALASIVSVCACTSTTKRSPCGRSVGSTEQMELNGEPNATVPTLN